MNIRIYWQFGFEALATPISIGISIESRLLDECETLWNRNECKWKVWLLCTWLICEAHAQNYIERDHKVVTRARLSHKSGLGKWSQRRYCFQPWIKPRQLSHEQCVQRPDDPTLKAGKALSTWDREMVVNAGISLGWKVASFVCTKRSSKAGCDLHCWWPAHTSMAVLLALSLSLCNLLFLYLLIGESAVLLAPLLAQSLCAYKQNAQNRQCWPTVRGSPQSFS